MGLEDVKFTPPEGIVEKDWKAINEYFRSIEKKTSVELTYDIIKRYAWNVIKQKCPKFILTEENKQLLIDLSGYVVGEGSLDARKGIYLYGAYGVGKSLIMQPFMQLLKVKQKSAISIVEEFDETNNFKSFCVDDWYFDDLGAEKLPKFYKSDAYPLMTEIIQLRYFKTHQGHNQSRTFVSTNLKPEKFNEMYGHRVGSRLPQMFNVIHLRGKDYRKE